MEDLGASHSGEAGDASRAAESGGTGRTGRVRNNVERSRYELVIEGQLVGVADYLVRQDTIVFPHTEIIPPLRGQGLGEELVAAALADIRGTYRRVEPLCWFVAEYLELHPDALAG